MAALPRRSPQSAAPTSGSSESEAPPSGLVDVPEEAPAVLGRRRRRRLTLVGAGHAHLQILDWWRERPIRGVDLTLVSPYPYAVYSAMLPSVIAGLIPQEEMLVDLGKLTDGCGAALVIDKAVGLDPQTRTLELAHHDEQPFDAVSINIGSANLREDLCQTHRAFVAVKPLATFLSRLELRLQELLAQWREAPGESLRFVVVGGGAAGVELALCLKERADREHWPAAFRLIEAGPKMLPGYANGTRYRVRKLFHKHSIPVQLGAPVVDCDEDGPAELILDNGERVRADLVIWAAGAAPPSLLQGYRLPLSTRGYLAVRPTLQTTADLPVFAAGDVADIVGRRCPKAGVFAVRQAPILWDNLRRWFRAEPLVEYEPQHGFMSLLSCGDGSAICDYRGWSFYGRWMWRLKQSIDRHFVRRFQ